MNEVRKVYHFDMVPIIISSLGYADILIEKASHPITVHGDDRDEVITMANSTTGQKAVRVKSTTVSLSLTDPAQPPLVRMLDLTLIAADMFIPRMQGPAFTYRVGHRNNDAKDWSATNLYWRALPIRIPDRADNIGDEEFVTVFQKLAQARQEAKKQHLEGKLT